jgi:DNA-binding NarL/FixJ family response regulator
MRKRILVADDYGSVRRALRALLGQRQDLEVCAEASSGKEAIEKVQLLSPDVVVLDLAMGGLNGLEAAQAIRAKCPGTAVLITSMHDAEPLFPRLQGIGVSGFVPKSRLAAELLLAIDAVLGGQGWFPTEMRCAGGPPSVL